MIEEIYYNSLSDQMALSEEYKKVSEKAYKQYKQLKEVLNEEQKKIFEDFTNSELDVCAEGEFSHFKEGLKVGLLLAMECLL